MEKYSIEPEKLRDDKDRLMNSLDIIMRAKDTITDNMKYLQKVWKGEAANLFFSSLAEKMTELESVVGDASQLTEWMQYACEIYSAAEERAQQAVNEINTVRVLLSEGV